MGDMGNLGNLGNLGNVRNSRLVRTSEPHLKGLSYGLDFEYLIWTRFDELILAEAA
jgi:hypothetical protein